MPILKRSVFLRRAAVSVACGLSAAASAAPALPALNEVGFSPGEAVAAADESFRLIEHRRSRAHKLTDLQANEDQPRFHRASSRSRPASSNARDRVLTFIRAAELRHRLPTGLLDALVAVESGYRPFAVSKAGAAGLAQLMPGTAQDLGVTDRFDIRANLDGGARYLRGMLDQFGSVALALAAYNAGPGAVQRSRGIPLNGETPSYVARVLARWREMTGGAGR